MCRKIVFTVWLVFLVACSGTLAAPGPTATAVPEPTATPVAMAFTELAEIYERHGPEGTSALLERTRVQVEGVVASRGVGQGGHTGLEFTQFSIEISADGSSFTGNPVNPQTGQILQPSVLHEIRCVQTKDQRDFGLWRFEEAPPIQPWPTNARVVVEGTFYLVGHAYPTLDSCRIIDITPAPG